MHANTLVTGVGFTSIGASILWVGEQIKKKVEADRAAREARLMVLEDNDRRQHAGTVALLHHELYELCNGHITRGRISTGDLDDLGYIYTSYKGLGGNGTGEALYNKVLALPIVNGGYDDDDNQKLA